MSALLSAIPSDTGSVPRPTTLVELLSWVYLRQKADVMSGRGLWGPEAEVEAAEEGHRLRRWSGCGCAQLAAIALLGARIDRSGWQRAVLHPDAELIHDEVLALGRTDWTGALLLQRYGRAGGAPEWEAHQEFEPVRDARDRIVQNRFEESCVVVDGRGRKIRVPARYCPVEKYPSDAWVTMIRGEYAAWHQALVALGRRLAVKPLTRWHLESLGAVAEPWESQENTDSVKNICR